jgi:hypothetical protein
MAQTTGYHATTSFLFSALDEAISRMLDLARTSGWKEIQLTNPTGKTWRVHISQDFTNLDDARNWIKNMAALGHFETSSISQK